MTKNKTWPLNKSHTLTLAPPNQRGICQKCHLKKAISVISERLLFLFTWEKRQFCQSCSLANLYELEQGDYQIQNKKAVISQIRETLNNQPVKEELLECYG